MMEQESQLVQKNETFIKQKVIENLEEWKDIKEENIQVTLLNGLTNLVYRVESSQASKPVIFRIFSQVEGLLDLQRQNKIFLKQGESGVGPKSFYYQKDNIRIQEYLLNCDHPTSEIAGTIKYRNLVAVKLAQFHLTDIEGVSKQLTKVDQMIRNIPLIESVKSKISSKQNFSQDYYLIVKKMQPLLEKEQLLYLQNLINGLQSNERVFCHNDLHNLNVMMNQDFSSLFFIDFDYSEFNFSAYDLANFINENPFQYLNPDSPFFSVVHQNQFSDSQIQQFCSTYLISKKLKTKDKIDAFFESIRTLEDYGTLGQLIELQKQQLAIERNQIDSFLRELLICRVFSQWHWIVWSICSLKHDNEIQFDYLQFGQSRLEIYIDLKKRLQEEYSLA